MKLFLVCLMMILTATDSTFSQTDDRKWFSIYLLPKNIKPNQLAKLDLKKLKSVGKPFVHQHEIYSYNQDTHQFRVSSYEFEEKLKKTNLIGRTFAVFVENEAIYAGAVWSSILSQSFDGVIINLNPIDKKPLNFKIELGYPTEKFFKGRDLRSDWRIFKAFEQVGKLFEDFEIIGKCKSIKPTYKHLPSDIFTFEVISVIKGNYDQKEISFEVYYHRGGGEIIKDLRKDGVPYDAESYRNFDENKELILRFEKRIGRPNPKYPHLEKDEYIFKDWSVKK